MVLVLVMMMILKMSLNTETDESAVTEMATVCGMKCLTPCARSSSGYSWCGQWSSKPKASGTTWDYCSIEGYTIYGKKCKNKCYNHKDTRYFWCNLEDGSWDYCSPSRLYGNGNYGCYWTSGKVAELVLFISLMSFCLAVIGFACWNKCC